MYLPSVPASIEGEVEEQEEVEDNAASYQHLRIEFVRFNQEEPEELNKENNNQYYDDKEKIYKDVIKKTYLFLCSFSTAVQLCSNVSREPKTWYRSNLSVA